MTLFPGAFSWRRLFGARPFLLLTILAMLPDLRAEWVWVEGEDATKKSLTHHSWYAGVKQGELSGGAFASHWDEAREGSAEYEFSVKEGGHYTLYLRANTVQAELAASLNGGELKPVDLVGDATDSMNIANDGKPDLRFLSWVNAGEVDLKVGQNQLRVVMRSSNNHHGMLDCFLVTNESFLPAGKSKPGEALAAAGAEPGWRAWNGDTKALTAKDSRSVISLRGLNEKVAGENGRILSKGGNFVHEKGGKPVRFWAVNGPPHDLSPAALDEACQTLARYGVNLVRLHRGMFDRATGKLDPAEVATAQRIVRAAAKEGIYSHASIYFPLWMEPRGDLPFLKGTAGKHPFASLYFNKDFQEVYRGWWKTLLTEPDEEGKRLIDDPALMGLELVNEDSFFFWTFNSERLAPQELEILEGQFAAWAKKKYGSYDAAFAAWNGARVPRDAPAEDRLGMRPLWNMFNEKTPRDQDTAAFLVEVQRGFYADTIRYLRELGYKGLITCSNWTTASDEIFGPLEKYTYTVGDFVDRHGYFGGAHTGSDSGWSIREGHVFGSRSALRFEGGKPGSPPQFTHPVMDPKYNGLPSMISETTWTRPNAYRGEAPLYYAIYGALQDTDSIVHFAHDGARWDVKPRFFMQPWTLMAPTQVGQFPAAAAIYRLGLVETGQVMADLQLNLKDLLDLKGTPLVQSASLDELRAADTPGGERERAGNPRSAISPLIHYVGRVNVNISDKPAASEVKPLGEFVDLSAKTVLSSTRQVKLDFGRGVLAVDAPRAQVVAGNLKPGKVELSVLSVSSELEQLYVALVPMDGQPLTTSKNMLLQVMTEEKPAGFTTEPAGEGLQRITSLGKNPWLIREPSGAIQLKRAGGELLSITPLDDNGIARQEAQEFTRDGSFSLQPGSVYYWIRG